MVWLLQLKGEYSFIHYNYCVLTYNDFTSRAFLGTPGHRMVNHYSRSSNESTYQSSGSYRNMSGNASQGTYGNVPPPSYGFSRGK